MSFGIPVRNGLSIGLLASTFLTSGSGRLVPRLTLNFLTGAPLDSRITFSRTTNATLVDSTGLVTYAPNNLVLRSEEFDNAFWTKANATVTSNATVAPNGTTTADAIIENTATATHGVNGTIAVTAGVSYVLSVYAKQNGRSLLRIGSATTSKYAVFDLNAGVVQYVDAGVSASITSLGNGWYRCAATQAETTTGSTNFLFRMQSSTSEWPGTGQYTGNGTSGVFLWGAQLEAVTYQTLPSTYVQTVASAYYGPRFDYNPVTLAARGLLIEEQRVNLALYSEQFDNAVYIKVRASITANATTSPDGTANADKLVEDTTATNTHLIQLQGGFSSFVSGTTYVISGYAKAGERTSASISMGTDGGVFAGQSANFNFSTGVISAQFGVATFAMTDAGNGWYRWSIAATPAASGAAFIRFQLIGPAGGTSYTGDGVSGLFLWGNQLEVGAFPTSYIPTVASTVTRASDTPTITGANFASWYNASEGTIVVSADSSRGGTPASARTFQFDDNTSDNNIRAAGQSTLQVVDATVTQATIAGTPLIPFDGTVFKFASAYKLNDFATVTTGAVTTDTSGTVPTAITQLQLGRGVGGSILNGHIRTLTYYATRLTNAQLQALSA
jgi:hypothetical protein